MIAEHPSVQTPTTLDGIKSQVREDIIAQDALIALSLNSPVLLIQEIGQHIILSGGKRIRPLLTLLTARALGIESNQHHILAVIIEFIHTATLLHDDVVDHSSLRRGKVTAHALWGPEAAVLTGDFLYSRAFQLMAKLNHLEVMSILANTTNTIAEGEVLQLQHVGRMDISETEYRSVILSKTATLFAAACELSAVIVGKPQHQESLRLFGQHLGMAYQMRDDLLDYTSHEDILGKCIGDDLAEGKITLPLIHAFQQSSAAEAEKIQILIRSHNRDSACVQTMIQFIEKYQGFGYTFQKIKQETVLAHAALDHLPQNIYTETLLQLLTLLTERIS